MRVPITVRFRAAFGLQSPRAMRPVPATSTTVRTPIADPPICVESETELSLGEYLEEDSCEDAGAANPFVEPLHNALRATPLSASEEVEVFRGMYDRASAVAADRYRTAISALNQYGLGEPSDRALFEERLAGVVEVLKAEGTKKQLESVICLLGQRPERAARMAERLWSGEHALPGPTQPGAYMPASMLDIDNILFDSGRQTHARFDARLAEVSAPFGGDSDQLFDLLGEFPDLADSLYAEAGFAPGSPEEKSYLEAASSWEWREEMYGYLKIGGLMAAGILLTVASGGALGPEAALMVGVGFAAATGEYQVYSAEEALRRADDARAVGIASEQTVRFRENELTGAYGALLVNVVTAGLFAKIGGGTLIDQGVRTVVREAATGVVIGSSAGALTTALNPNVWQSEDTAALILKGGIVGGAGGGLGALGGRAAAVTIGVARTALAPKLSVGSVVDVAFEGKTSPEQWRVARLDETNGRMMIEREGQTLTISVTEAQIVRVDGKAPSVVALRAVARAGRAKAGFDRSSAEHQRALANAEQAIDSIDLALRTADVAQAERGVTALLYARTRARAAGAEMLEHAGALGSPSTAAARKAVADGEARLDAVSAIEQRVARAKGTDRNFLSYFSDAEARGRAFEDLYLSGGPGRSPADAQTLFRLAGGVRTDSHAFREGDEIAPMVERIAAMNTPAFVIRGVPRNLAGINAAGGHTAGDDFYAAMAGVVVDELEKTGCKVYAYRDGGKATFIVTGGHPTEEAVSAALARADDAIASRVLGSQYAYLDHPKHPNDPAWRGSGMTFATAKLAPTDRYSTLTATLDAETARYNREVLGMWPGPDVAVKLSHAKPPARATIDPPVSRPAGARGFIDPISHRREQFIERARALGVPDREAGALFRAAGGERVDPETGYLFGEDRMPTVERAIAHAAATEDRAYYVEMDIRNLGAVNSALGREGAVAEFRVGAELIAEELRAIGADVSLFHHGGDEISAVIVGPKLEQAAIDGALTRAQTRYRAYMTERGLGVLEHPKYPGDESKRGIGFSFAIAEARADASAEGVRAAADQALEVVKKK